jgi:hypothetical protein
VNNIVTYSYDWDLEQKGEYKHLKLRDPVAAIKPSKAHIHLSNLFDGDKFLGKCHPHPTPPLPLTIGRTFAPKRHNAKGASEFVLPTKYY